MGSDDLFKKRRTARQKRKYEFRTPNTESYLIVTEGEKTEPLYFEGLRKRIQEKAGGSIHVKEVPVITIRGGGRATGRLIEAADEFVKNAKIKYKNVWIVFDKDDFDDFDQAVKTGESKGYKMAWSNESFEYWLYLHFEYSDAALHRDMWCEKLDGLFRKYQLGDKKYCKNYEDIYSIMDSFGGVDTAIHNAKRRMAGYNERQGKPSEWNPGTMVFALVDE